VNCQTARGLLAERAIGIVAARERAAVERHLSWCAACRKEAGDLERAATSLAFAVAPASPPQSLEGRVAMAVRREARTVGETTEPPAAVAVDGRRRRPRRRMVAARRAARLALGPGAGGAVLATRHSRPDPAVEAQRQKGRLADFMRAIQSAGVSDGTAQLGVLANPSGGAGSGSALALLSPSVDDRVLVMASGLRDAPKDLPYLVMLADGSGRFIQVGAVNALNTSGGFTVARVLDADLRGYVNVVVRDVHGSVVLSGTLREQAPSVAPTPSTP